MESFTKDELQAAVELTSMCMGIFDERTGRVHSLNRALREEVKLSEFRVTVTSKSDDRTFGRLVQGGIPVSLRVLTGRSPACLVEVYLAHTKESSSRSDVVELVEMTSDGVWEWFPTLQYEYMSERFWSILGYDYREMPPSPDAWTSIIDPNDLQKALKYYDVHVASKGKTPYNMNVSYTHKKGHSVQIKCRGAVVEWLPDGTPWRLLGTHTDITEITEAVDAKARFVSRMSHEIRTPISAILHECELLEDHSGTAVIADSCDQLLTLCNDILTVEKLCRPKAPTVCRTCVRVEEFLDKAIRRHSRAAESKGVELSGTVLAAPPGCLMLDVSKCNQVVDNMISNAIKYTDSAGYVDVEVHCRPCVSSSPPSSDNTGREHCSSARVEANGDTARASSPQQVSRTKGEGWLVELAVRDTGLGIHPEVQKVVFDRFRQANSSMRGAGLGLWISKELAHLMSGDIVLTHTEVGEGSTFMFSFPALVAPERIPARVTRSLCEGAVEEESESRRRSSKDEHRTDKAIIRILSVDDMKTNRKIMRRRLLAVEESLTAGRIEVADAVDGRDAVRVFREVGRFDAIFMDCLMPDINGFEAARAIHRLCDEMCIPRVPVIAVTASVSTALYHECKEAGMTQVITKPFDTMDLMAVFAALTEVDGGGRSSPPPSTTRIPALKWDLAPNADPPTRRQHVQSAHRVVDRPESRDL